MHRWSLQITKHSSVLQDFEMMQIIDSARSLIGWARFCAHLLLRNTT